MGEAPPASLSGEEKVRAKGPFSTAPAPGLASSPALTVFYFSRTVMCLHLGVSFGLPSSARGAGTERPSAEVRRRQEAAPLRA